MPLNTHTQTPTHVRTHTHMCVHTHSTNPRPLALVRCRRPSTLSRPRVCPVPETLIYPMKSQWKPSSGPDDHGFWKEADLCLNLVFALYWLMNACEQSLSFLICETERLPPRSLAGLAGDQSLLDKGCTEAASPA